MRAPKKSWGPKTPPAPHPPGSASGNTYTMLVPNNFYKNQKLSEGKEGPSHPVFSHNPILTENDTK